MNRMPTALLVDDDRSQTHLLSNFVRRAGYEPVECHYAPDCMDMVERLHPEVIVLDLTMPGMTGFDIADEIMHNPDLRPRRLIALTADGSNEARLQTASHGFDFHFVKPISVEVLLGALDAPSAGEGRGTAGYRGSE
jgi:CheY-like chemotaxis protein